jgi:hypothetical protein
MNDADKNLQRLLRAAAAAQTGKEEPVDMPFGFDTRVVALWREGKFPRNGVGGLLRRVALLSAAVLVVSTFAVLRELKQNNEAGDLATNEFALADSAIQSEFLK